MTRAEGRAPTKSECLAGFGAAMAISNDACDRMTPREQAEAAWTPTSRRSIDELEDRIRAERGMVPRDRSDLS